MSLAPLQSPSFPQLLRSLGSLALKRLGVDPFPAMLLHAVTEACNARCGYCVFRHGQRRPDELSLAEIKDLYAQARRLGMGYLHLWGGEPSLHPEIGAIAREGKSQGFYVGMVSNGALIAPKMRELAPSIDRFFFSLDQPNSKHDAMRQAKGLFNRVMAAVEAVRIHSPKTPVVLLMTLGRENRDAILEMALLAQRLDTHLWVIPMRRAASRGQSAAAEGAIPPANSPSETDPNAQIFELDNSDQMLPLSELRAAYTEILKLKNLGFKIYNSHYTLTAMAQHGRLPPFRCHWPRLNATIDANGDVVDCMNWRAPLGNLRQRPLREILSSPRQQALAGAVGQACNLCNTPNRIDPSRLWDGHIDMIANFFERP